MSAPLDFAAIAGPGTLFGHPMRVLFEVTPQEGGPGLPFLDAEGDPVERVHVGGAVLVFVANRAGALLYRVDR